MLEIRVQKIAENLNFPHLPEAEALQFAALMKMYFSDDIDVEDLAQALQGETKTLHSYCPGTTWANEMHFGMNHAPVAGLIAC